VLRRELRRTIETKLIDEQSAHNRSTEQ